MEHFKRSFLNIKALMYQTKTEMLSGTLITKQ